MNLLEAIILGILQGITEFLPISSSGHLIIGEDFLGLEVENLESFDVIIHIATLAAIFVYFWKDIFQMIKAFLKLITGKLSKDDPYGKLIFYIVIGTIPAVILGFFGEEWLNNSFRNLFWVGIWMIISGIFYLIGEVMHKYIKNSNINWSKALIIGVAQSIALIPSVSRSGSTIVAGLFQGIDRKEAARFSFLLSIPAIMGAGLLTVLKIPENGGIGVDMIPLIGGFLSAFIFGLLSIYFLMKFLKNHSLIIFATYLIALGTTVLI